MTRSKDIEAMTTLLERTRDVATFAGRSDLANRLTLAAKRVGDPRMRIVIVGPLKQGKSQLVNTLVDLPVCSVGDDETTAVPTVVNYAETDRVEIVCGEERFTADLSDVPSIGQEWNGLPVTRIEVSVAAPALSAGLVFVDTPGVGGAGNPYAAATLGLLPSADAVLVVSDSSQEFTAPELAFLRQVTGLCPAVAIVQTKTDLYPHWRQIMAANEAHLTAAELAVPIIPVSSLLRSHAVRLGDEDLAVESNFGALLGFLQRTVIARADITVAKAVALDTTSVTEHLTLTLSSELAGLRDPSQRAAAISKLTAAKAEAEALHRKTSGWQQALADGISDLAADIEHDLRDRLRRVTKDAEELVDEADPTTQWPRIESWLQEQTAAVVGDNFVWAYERAQWLAEVVAGHFSDVGETELPHLSQADIDEVMAPVGEMSEIDDGGAGIGHRLLTGMRGSYGGVLMFGLVATVMGFSLINPVSIGAGLVLGTKAYREDKTARLQRARAEAKLVIRRYTDDVSFQVGKESKDRLRQVQRILRDHFTLLADSMVRSLSESLALAQHAAEADADQRRIRTAEIERRLSELAELRRGATTVAQVAARMELSRS